MQQRHSKQEGTRALDVPLSKGIIFLHKLVMRFSVTVNRSPESKGTDFQHPQGIFSWDKPLSLVDDLFTLVPSQPILLSPCFTLAEAFVGLSDLWSSNVCQDSHFLERLARKEGKSFKCGPEEIRPQTMDRTAVYQRQDQRDVHQKKQEML